jgi:hypothetical protein
MTPKVDEISKKFPLPLTQIQKIVFFYYKCFLKALP